MKMDKLLAGLIAFVAGVALSAGSAFAQVNGYVGGDPSVIKLIPYYEAGETKATIIGVQNMSMREAATVEQHALVADIRSFLMGGNAITTRAQAALVAEGATAVDLVVGTTELGEDDLNTKAFADAALETAMEAVMTEHLFIAVNAYDAKGMMVGSAELCLAENQFGVVVLQGMSAMMANSYQMQTLSMMDDEIPAYGWVKVIAETQKLSECGAGTRTSPRVNILTAGHATPDDDTDDSTMNAQTQVAAWTIIQDVGDGFFGTEVPTTTFNVADLDSDMDTPMTAACYDSDGNTAGFQTDATGTGAFSMTTCGMIPERANNTRTDADSDPDTPTVLTNGTATVRGSAYARYDIGDESMIVLWLASGEDTEDTRPRMSRDVQVMVQCENGMVVSQMENEFEEMADIMIDAKDKLTKIDPSMGAVGDATAMCEGDRGVLQIMMPDRSHAGMAFTHITQMMGHYRMNFPAYGMAADTACTADNCP